MHSPKNTVQLLSSYPCPRKKDGYVFVYKNTNSVLRAVVCLCVGTSRQALQELRTEAVRQQAEDEAWYTQQELIQQAEDQRRRILQEEESKLAHQRTRSLLSPIVFISFSFNRPEIRVFVCSLLERPSQDTYWIK